MKTLILLLIFLGLQFHSQAQGPFHIKIKDTSYRSTYAGFSADTSGYILISRLINQKGTTSGYTIMRLNLCNEILADSILTFPLYRDFWLYDAARLRDGSKLLLFSLVNTNYTRTLLICLDSKMNKKWSISFLNHSFFKIYPLDDGGFYLAGSRNIFRFNKNGNNLWGKQFYGEPDIKSLFAMDQMGNIICLFGNKLYKLDLEGHLAWVKSIEATDDFLYPVQLETLASGQIIVCCSNFRSTHFNLALIDSAGSLINAKEFTGTGDTVTDYFYGVNTSRINDFFFLKGDIFLKQNLNKTLATFVLKMGTGLSTLSAKKYSKTMTHSSGPIVDYQNGIFISKPLLDSDFAFNLIHTDQWDNNCYSDSLAITSSTIQANIYVDTFHLYNDTLTSKDYPVQMLPHSSMVEVICSFPFPYVNLGPDTTVCSQSSLKLDISKGNYNCRFLWSTGDTTPSIIVTKEGAYWARATYGHCQYSDTITIRFSHTGSLHLHDTTICQGDIFSLSTKRNDQHFLWYLPDGSSDTGSVISNLHDTGTYTVSVPDSGKCEWGRVHVSWPDIRPDFTWKPSNVNTETGSVTFNNLSRNTTGVKWKIDSLATLSGDTVKYNFPDTGNYMITMIVQSSTGCEESVSKTLRVNDIFRFFIPDAFTPNGDSVNEVFAPKGTFIDHYEMKIYNRWGEEIYKGSKGWDGRFKGSRVSDGLYLYLITVTDRNYLTHYYKGNVTVIH
jgi:gliding motility-associated-like protein